MKINKKIAAGLGTVAGAAVLAGVAFVGIAPANAAAAGANVYCQYNVHKVDVKGNPVVGAEFSYTPGPSSLQDPYQILLANNVQEIIDAGVLVADSADALTQARKDAVNDASVADEQQAIVDAQAAVDAAVGAAAKYVKGEALIAAKQKLTAAIDLVPAVVDAIKARSDAAASWSAVAGLSPARTFTTDSKGDFTYVTYCIGASLFPVTVLPTLVETKAPAGLQLAGDIFLSGARDSTFSNANVTYKLGPIVDALTDTRINEVTVVDQPLAEGEKQVAPVVTPVVTNSVVKVAASHK